MSYSDSFPSVSPSWQCNFSANGGRLDPRITFSRSDTPPTYAAPSAVHYWSNEKHLSSENLMVTSGDISNDTPWNDSNTSRSTSGTFLDGSDSYLIAETATTGSHFAYSDVSNNGVAVTSGVSYTLTVFAKAGTVSVMQLFFPSGQFGSNAYANYDLSNALTTPVTGSSATATITALGSDWVKLTIAATATSSGSASMAYFAFANDDINSSRATSYAGNAASNFIVWQANVSTTGQTVLNETSGQIHREYAPTLKSVSYAGQPRFEYSPTDSASEAIGSSRGLLIEGQSTNLATRSDEFDLWSYARVNRTANAAVAPSGSLTADLVYADGTASNTHLVQSSFTATAAAYTFSVYAKAAGCNYVRLSFENIGSGYGHFDLANGTVTASNTTSQIESVGNGWWRVSITETLSSGTSYGRISISTSSGTVYWDGDDYSGVLLSAAQIEQNSFPSSPIATSGSTVTRASDSASAVASDIGYTGGPVSLFAEGTAQGENTGGGQVLFAVHKNDDNRIGIWTRRNSKRIGLVSGGGISSGLEESSWYDGKTALSLDTNSFSGSINGRAVLTDTSQPLPDFSGATVYLGNLDSATTYRMNGHIKRVALYNEALSDTNLQALTS